MDLPKQGSMPIRGIVGIATTLSEPLTLKAHAGWGYAPYDGGSEGYNGPLLDLEIGYQYAPAGRVVAEYNYDYEDSINANYFRDHKFQARIDQQLIEKLLLSGSIDFRLRGYRGITGTVGAMSPSRDDVVFSARPDRSLLPDRHVRRQHRPDRFHLPHGERSRRSELHAPRADVRRARGVLTGGAFAKPLPHNTWAPHPKRESAASDLGDEHAQRESVASGIGDEHAQRESVASGIGDERAERESAASDLGDEHAQREHGAA